MDAKILRLYVDDMKERSKQMLIPFKELCKRRRVGEIIVSFPPNHVVSSVTKIGEFYQ